MFKMAKFEKSEECEKYSKCEKYVKKMQNVKNMKKQFCTDVTSVMVDSPLIVELRFEVGAVSAR
jgi:hypothetical protein